MTDALEPRGPVSEVPAIRVTMTVTCSPHRQIGFETVVEQGIHENDFDELIDRMAHVADRQQAKVELVEHEKQLTILRNMLVGAAKDLVQRQEEYGAEASELSPGRRGVVKLSTQHRANLDQLRKGVEEYKLQIETREQTMARCRALIDGASAPLAEAAE